MKNHVYCFSDEMFQMISLAMLFSNDEKEETIELSRLKQHYRTLCLRKMEASINKTSCSDTFISEKTMGLYNKCLSDMNKLAQMQAAMFQGPPKRLQ